jgi:uncharacterized membrane protein YgdD (TMEM256/DUF423 family)
VASGAFGAHGLKARLAPNMLEVWQTAVRYHAWHALGLLAVGLGPEGPWTGAAGWLLVLGIVLFSGSLYGLALGAPKSLGIVTPIGGLAFLLGWIAFAIGVISAKTPA